MEYKTVTHLAYGYESDCEILKERFDEKVNEEIQKGWKPQGGVNLSRMVGQSGLINFIFSIGMIKE